MATKVFISDTLVIRATHPPASTGGVGRWTVKVTKAAVKAAKAAAIVGDPDNKRPGHTPGCYKAGFAQNSRGSNGHQFHSMVWNGCPHAYFVEYGRKPSFGYEAFVTGGKWRHSYAGTAGFKALRPALTYKTMVATAKAWGMDSTPIRRVAGGPV